jgi:heat shock protein HtpX
MNFNTLKTTVLLAALTGLLMLIGNWLGGTAGLIVGFLLAAAMNFGSYWFSHQIALKMAGAREVSYAEAPELHTLVAQLARASGLPKPRVALVESEAPNAFATGRNANHGLVAVTTGILRLLDRRELAAVLAHELGHIRNRDILVSSMAATIAGAITMLAQMGQFTLMFGGSSQDDEAEGGGGVLGGLLMLIVAPIAATIIQLAISRARVRRRQDWRAREPRSRSAGCGIGEAGSIRAAHPAAGEPGGLAFVYRQTADRFLGAEAVQHASAHGRARSPLAAHGAADRPHVR